MGLSSVFSLLGFDHNACLLHVHHEQTVITVLTSCGAQGSTYNERGIDGLVRVGRKKERMVDELGHPITR